MPPKTSPWIWSEKKQKYYRISRDRKLKIFQDGTEVEISDSEDSKEPDPSHVIDEPRKYPDADEASKILQPTPSAEDYTSGYYDVTRLTSRVSIDEAAPTIQTGLDPFTQLRTADDESEGFSMTHATPSDSQAAFEDADEDESKEVDKIQKVEDMMEDMNLIAQPIPREEQRKYKSSKLSSDFQQVEKYIRKTYFVPGRVFRAEWAEPHGNPKASKDSSSKGKRRGQEVTSALGGKIHVKIQWFVVIMSWPRHCWCLPVNTYQGQGVSKDGVLKNEHSIIFVGEKEPKPDRSELPYKGEQGMLDSIRVIPNSRVKKLDIMSRICYSKVYTVEYNIKVDDFGMVHKNFLPTLRSNFVNQEKMRAVWEYFNQEKETNPYGSQQTVAAFPPLLNFTTTGSADTELSQVQALEQILNNSFDPRYQQVYNDILQNPEHNLYQVLNEQIAHNPQHQLYQNIYWQILENTNHPVYPQLFEEVLQNPTHPLYAKFYFIRQQAQQAQLNEQLSTMTPNEAHELQQKYMQDERLPAGEDEYYESTDRPDVAASSSRLYVSKPSDSDEFETSGREYQEFKGSFSSEADQEHYLAHHQYDKDNRSGEKRSGNDSPKEDRSGGDRSKDDRPRYDKGSRGNSGRDDRSRDDRLRDDRLRDNRSRDDRSRDDRARYDDSSSKRDKGKGRRKQ